MWLTIFVIIIILLVSFVDLFLAVYVYRQNPKQRINKNFFYFGLAIFIWCLVNFVSLIAKDIFWLRLAYSTGTLVPLTGIPFAFALANKKVSKVSGVFIYGTSIVIFIINIFTPLLIKSLSSFSELGIYANFGLFFYVWGIHLIILSFIAIYVPLPGLKKTDELRRKQILYFTTGATIFATWTILVNVIFPFFGFTQLTNIDTPATIFLVGFTSYSIIKFQLMNIRSLFFQAIVYSFVIVAIITFLLVLMFTASFLFAQAMIWPVYVMAFLISIILFFIGRLFFVEKRDLEKAKTNLIKLLSESEEHRRKAESERDKTSTIVENFTDGLIIINERHEIISINPETIKILELDVARLLGKPLASLLEFPKAQSILLILNEGVKDIFRKEVELAKDFIIELSTVPLNIGALTTGHLIVLHDVSREKTVERMKTEFVSLVAHQLRTPLSIIKWSVSMLKNGDFGKLNKKQGEIIKSTFNNNERLILLVNDLLNVTHLEEGIYLYKMAMIDIKEVVLFLIDNCKDVIKKRKIKITFNSVGVIPEIMLDSVKIKLAVQNFIDNAIKYSYDGGEIVITLSANEKNIEFKIKDSGMGIPENQQDKIFTKFFRGENAIKMRDIGSGLGLYLSKNIIEAHGGKIWFESQEGLGTSFFFSLPNKNN